MRLVYIYSVPFPYHDIHGNIHCGAISKEKNLSPVSAWNNLKLELEMLQKKTLEALSFLSRRIY